MVHHATTLPRATRPGNTHTKRFHSPPNRPKTLYEMTIHASCAALDGAGVLLMGPPGSGKSDLVLRLLRHGFDLVADDRVELEHGVARAPEALAGLLEVRGLGIVRMPHVAEARVALVARMGSGDRLPEPETWHGLPLVHIDPASPSAPDRVALALRCAQGTAWLVAGAFATVHA